MLSLLEYSLLESFRKMAQNRGYWDNTDTIDNRDLKKLDKEWSNMKGTTKLKDPKTGIVYGAFKDSKDKPVWMYNPDTMEISYGPGRNIFVYIKDLED